MSQGVAGLGEPPGPATVETTAEQIGAAAGDKASGENFPVALRLLPARYRRDLQAVYGYARAVDDMGDEAPPAGSPVQGPTSKPHQPKVSHDPGSQITLESKIEEVEEARWRPLGKCGRERGLPDAPNSGRLGILGGN